jgi:hypothetical protein
VILGGATGALIATDKTTEKQFPNTREQVRLGTDTSYLGEAYTLIPFAVDWTRSSWHDCPSTCKAMAEAARDAISLAKQGVRRNGGQFGKSSDHQTGLGRADYQAQITTPSDDPLCSTTGFLAVWEGSLLPVVVAICCNLLQAESDRRNCCRVFTNCCNLLQSPKTRKFGVPMGSPHFLSR